VRWALPWALAAAALAAGCDDLGDFTTEPGEAYCGQVTLGKSFRTGFSPRVQMRLRFDAAGIASGASPGTVTTFDAGAPPLDQRLLDEAALRPMPALVHDPLAQLEFGDGRERNLLYAVSPADAQADSLLAVLSLRTDEAVEVRLIRPGAAGLEAGTADPVARRRGPLFGLFTLERQRGDCGF
jgi:hypothetical protein